MNYVVDKECYRPQDYKSSGAGNWKKGAGSEYSETFKWARSHLKMKE